MALSKKQLMQPQYKVIADYPQPKHIDDNTDNHIFIIGDILRRCNVNGIETFRRTGRCSHMSVGIPTCKCPEKYPAIFQPLPWYAERKVEDMPEYIKCIEGEAKGMVIKCQYRIIANEIECKNINFDDTYWIPLEKAMQGTEISNITEYTNHINSLNKQE